MWLLLQLHRVVSSQAAKSAGHAEVCAELLRHGAIAADSLEQKLEHTREAFPAEPCETCEAVTTCGMADPSFNVSSREGTGLHSKRRGVYHSARGGNQCGLVSGLSNTASTVSRAESPRKGRCSSLPHLVSEQNEIEALHQHISAMFLDLLVVE